MCYHVIIKYEIMQYICSLFTLFVQHEGHSTPTGKTTFFLILRHFTFLALKHQEYIEQNNTR